MNTTKTRGLVRTARRLLFVVWIGASLSGSASGVKADTQNSPQVLRPEIQGLLDECLNGDQATVAFHPHTKKVSFIGTAPGQPIPQPRRLSQSASPEDAARSYLSTCGPLFGVSDQSSELIVNRIAQADAQRSVIRFQQVYEGIPVVAGELVAQLDGANNIILVNGEMLSEMKVDTRATVDAATAEQTALQAVAEEYQATRDNLATTSPALWIYNPTLINPAGGSTTRLVWRMEVAQKALRAIRQFILVDAHSGSVVLSLNLLHTARNRSTYTAGNTTIRPGTLVCNESNPTCAGGDTHAVNAHVYSGDTYNFYSSYHGRDSLDNAGMGLISTVHYDSGYCNAFWDGAQMTYGDGCFVVVDDVVAHEMTHGVTEHESNLVYAYESGAINESLSDVWGEYVDLVNGSGTDTAAVRWLIGEDVSVGAVRNMKDPPAMGDPDRMGSALYYHGTLDNGGVHTNSGVNNKAAYLMTDGGTFNGYTVTGIGITKAAKVYYEAQTNILTSGSGYLALYEALFQACNTLVGTGVTTAADCVQVRNATLATEMDDATPPPANDNFASATHIPVTSYTVTQGTTGATTAADDPFLTCVIDIGQGFNSVWYRYSPSVSGTLALNTNSSNYDTVLAVWTGSQGSLTSVGCDDDGGDGVQSLLSVPVTQGQTYHIEVASYVAGGGTLTLNASGPAPVPGTVPVAATLVSPSGTIGTPVPTYTWNAVSNSTWYYLWMDGPSGNLITQWYSATEAGCAGGTGTCSVTPSVQLTDGNHLWWIRTWNALGYGPWSAARNFTVSVVAPSGATLVSPALTISTTTPTYTWNAMSSSTWYYLWVDGPSGNVIQQWYTAAQAGCAGGTGTCSVTPATVLSIDAHRWWIRTWNSGGYGPWSTGMDFTVSLSPPSAATLVSPSGTTNDTTPAYAWNAVSNSTWYYLWVNGPSGNVIQQWYTAAQAGCGGGAGTCSVTPATVLINGAHMWWIQTWNPYGYGSWSAHKDFTVGGGMPPGGSGQLGLALPVD